MRSNESGHESGRNTLQINVKLTDGKIGCQELLVNTTKQTPEIRHERPQAFNGIDMAGAPAIAIIITRPFFAGMTDGVVGTGHVVVASPFIGIDLGILVPEVFDRGRQGLAVGVVDHA